MKCGTCVAFDTAVRSWGISGWGAPLAPVSKGRRHMSKDDGWIERRLTEAKSAHSLPDSAMARMRAFLHERASGRALRAPELAKIVEELMATMIGSIPPSPEEPREN